MKFPFGLKGPFSGAICAVSFREGIYPSQHPPNPLGFRKTSLRKKPPALDTSGSSWQSRLGVLDMLGESSFLVCRCLNIHTYIDINLNSHIHVYIYICIDICIYIYISVIFIWYQYLSHKYDVHRGTLIFSNIRFQSNPLLVKHFERKNMPSWQEQETKLTVP